MIYYYFSFIYPNDVQIHHKEGNFASCCCYSYGIQYSSDFVVHHWSNKCFRLVYPKIISINKPMKCWFVFAAYVDVVVPAYEISVK